VIHEIDASLDLLVRSDALEGSGTEVVFEAPTKEWAGRRNSPTVNLYLYDIREDSNRRHVGVITDYGDDGLPIARREPLRYFRLTYLVTAWTQRPQDEHRLLSSMLASFLRSKTIPTEMLVGGLATIGAPVLVEVGRPPDARSISEVWTALGGELKASLDLVISAPMSTAPVLITTPFPEEGTTVRLFGASGQEDTRSPRHQAPAAEVVPAKKQAQVTRVAPPRARARKAQ